MLGQVVQKLNLVALPPGFTFTITGITPIAPPPKAWKVEIVLADGLKIGYNGKRYPNPPPRFPIVLQPGLIGTVKFDGYNPLSSSGPGGQVYITFSFKGSATSEGKTTQIDDTGTIEVTTTDWKGTSRPESTNITYSTTKKRPPTGTPTFLRRSIPPNGLAGDANFGIVKATNSGVWSLQGY